MKYIEILTKAKERLTAAGVHDPEVDAWEIFSEAFGINKKDYLMIMRDEADEAVFPRFEELMGRRENREPLQQILGRCGFMDLEFKVNRHVLSPRQDTEILVEQALKRLSPGMDVLDLCTGSGCVLISLMHNVKNVSGTGVDISEEAIKLASENAAKNFVHPHFICSDLFEGIEEGRCFDMITANPPYIPTKIIEGLMPEVRDFEPRRALDGDEDGLKFYRIITEQAPDYLEPGGWLLFEIGVDQKLDVETLMFDRGFSDIHCFKDYSGNDRVVAGAYM